MRGQKKGKKTLSYFDLVDILHGIVEKSIYDNTKSCPKFGMATYTKEIVIIK